MDIKPNHNSDQSANEINSANQVDVNNYNPAASGVATEQQQNAMNEAKEPKLNMFHDVNVFKEFNNKAMMEKTDGMKNKTTLQSPPDVEFRHQRINNALTNLYAEIRSERTKLNDRMMEIENKIEKMLESLRRSTGPSPMSAASGNTVSIQPASNIFKAKSQKSNWLKMINKGTDNNSEVPKKSGNEQSADASTDEKQIHLCKDLELLWSCQRFTPCICDLVHDSQHNVILSTIHSICDLVHDSQHMWSCPRFTAYVILSTIHSICDLVHDSQHYVIFFLIHSIMWSCPRFTPYVILFMIHSIMWSCPRFTPYVILFMIHNICDLVHDSQHRWSCPRFTAYVILSTIHSICDLVHDSQHYVIFFLIHSIMWSCPRFTPYVILFMIHSIMWSCPRFTPYVILFMIHNICDLVHDSQHRWSCSWSTTCDLDEGSQHISSLS